jgi:hypothetical protein
MDSRLKCPPRREPYGELVFGHEISEGNKEGSFSMALCTPLHEPTEDIKKPPMVGAFAWAEA